MNTFTWDEIQTTPKLQKLEVNFDDQFTRGISKLNVNMIIQKCFKEKDSETTSRAEAIEDEGFAPQAINHRNMKAHSAWMQSQV